MQHVAIVEEILQKGRKCEFTQVFSFAYLLLKYSKRMDGKVEKFPFVFRFYMNSSRGLEKIERQIWRLKSRFSYVILGVGLATRPGNYSNCTKCVNSGPPLFY